MTGGTASVNLSTDRACISALAPVSAQDLADVIRAAGYTAELARTPDSPPCELRHQGCGFPGHLRVRP